MFPPQGLVKAVDTRVATVIVAQDGSGDYTDIQSGINALPATGGVVYIKEGTYTITSTIDYGKNNVSLIGAGFSTIIKGADGANVDPLIDLSYQYCTVSNLAIDGNKINNGSGDGTYFGNNYNIVENCYIHDVGSDCLTIYGMYNKIINNIVENAGLNGIRNADDYNIISGNLILNSLEDGIFNDAGDSSIFINNVVLNTTTARGIAIGSASSDMIVANNYVENAASDGISVRAVGGSISSNNIVEGNIVMNCGGWGINISKDGVSTLDRTIVVNNRLINNTSGGIRDTGTNTQIAHNIE